MTKFIDIENTNNSYIDLLNEINDHQADIDKNVQYLLTGLIACKKLSDQEYKVLINRVLLKNKFIDIACEMSLHQSTVKTYYKRSLKKLNIIAMEVDLKIKRK